MNFTTKFTTKFSIKFSYLLIVNCLLLIVNCSKAQINNQNLESNFPDRTQNLKKIQFSANVFVFVHNREYFNNIADGYTLIGYWVNPKIAYQPSEKVLIEAGVFLRKEIGNSGIAEIEPTFTIKIKNKNWSYLFGNLEGNLSHKLVEPLLNFERVTTKPLEHGIQAKYQNNSNFLDIWLDYQQSTIAGMTRQEHFFGGFSSNVKLFKVKNLEIRGIAQISIFHQGGQNLVNNSLPIRTLLNPALGINEKLNFGESAINFQQYYVGYFEGTKNGSAFYSNISYEKNNWQAMLSYWNSTNFVSPFGGDLYQSTSREFGNASYYEPHRELLFLRIIKDWKVIDGMSVSLRIEPYFDFRNQLFEHAEGIYLKYGL